MINSTPSEPKEMLGEEERKEERKENAQQMFGIIDSTIRSERLYANTALQRQDICERFGISRHTLNVPSIPTDFPSHKTSTIFACGRHSICLVKNPT